VIAPLRRFVPRGGSPGPSLQPAPGAPRFSGGGRRLWAGAAGARRFGCRFGVGAPFSRAPPAVRPRQGTEGTRTPGAAEPPRERPAATPDRPRHTGAGTPGPAHRERRRAVDGRRHPKPRTGPRGGRGGERGALRSITFPSPAGLPDRLHLGQGSPRGVSLSRSAPPIRGPHTAMVGPCRPPTLSICCAASGPVGSTSADSAVSPSELRGGVLWSVTVPRECRYGGGDSGSSPFTVPPPTRLHG
jgi:hypothetical protein